MNKNMKNKYLVLIVIIILVSVAVYIYTNKPNNKVSVDTSIGSGDEINIDECSINYPKTIENENITYKCTPISASEGKNPGLISSITFLYIPETQADIDLNKGWESCPLPSISVYTTDPTNVVQSATVNTVRNIDNKYYVYEGDMHEPCYGSDGSKIISGDAEVAWRSHRDEVRKIFDSLSAN